MTSADVQEGAPLARPQWSSAAGGVDRSPQLSWAGFPAATRSFAVTCLDPDAPSGSGWWHWSVANLPVSVTSLEAGAGGAGRSAAARRRARAAQRGGLVAGSSAPAPPRGTGVHRYLFVVHALDVPGLELDEDASPAILGARCFFHALARGILTATATRD